MRIGIRIAALIVILAGIVLVVRYRGQFDPAVIRAGVAGNALAPLIFVVMQVVASLLFVPRTVLGIAAGLLFGMFWGSVWAMIGAMMGAATGFAFVRWMGAAGTLDVTPGIGRLIERAEQGGWRSVAILRLAPIPHSAANTALALTNLSWRDYLIGSFAGMLPMTLAQVEIGASGGVVFEGQGEWIAGSLLLAAGLAASFLLKRASAKWR